MKKSRFFDKAQLLITIIGLSAFAVSLIFYMVMVLTAKVTYKESGDIDQVIYNSTLMCIYGIFSSTHLLMLAWFIIRALTFKRRMKEIETQNNILPL